MEYTGPAPVSRYFRPKPAPASSATQNLTTALSSSSMVTLTEETSTLGVDESQNSITSKSSIATSITAVEMASVGLEETDVAVQFHSVHVDLTETQPDVTPSAHASQQRLVAAFRGRQLVGQIVSLPDGYSGLILQAPSLRNGNVKECTETGPSKPQSKVTAKLASTRRSGRKSVRARKPKEDVTMEEDADLVEEDLQHGLLQEGARQLVPTSTFSSFTIWSPDIPVDEGKDEYIRALVEWTRLAAEVYIKSLHTVMLSRVTLAVLLAVTSVVRVRADPTPTAPGPGDIFFEGQTCSTAWDVDPTGLWTTMHIELMTGDNYNMVHLASVGIVDGTDPTMTTFSYICPQVSPHAAIYFYQYSSPATSNLTWTTRFTITNTTADIVSPPQSTQPGGANIPWGTGSLVDASGSNSTSSSSAAATTPFATTSSAFPVTTGDNASSSTSSAIASATSTKASGATSTMTTSNSVWRIVFALGISALGFTVMF
ncbi:hypothetical protein ID866_3092 [Astraeus odoratus]|nr:hypothetical protein ID866_3092 [Astraeus odoratus]